MVVVGQLVLVRYLASKAKRDGCPGVNGSSATVQLWQTQRWYSGIVKQVHADGTSRVKFDDGDHEDHILPEFIRSKASHSPTRPLIHRRYTCRSCRAQAETAEVEAVMAAEAKSGSGAAKAADSSAQQLCRSILGSTLDPTPNTPYRYTRQ